jgi:xylan 1,4-beta-xylosidase
MGDGTVSPANLTRQRTVLLGEHKTMFVCSRAVLIHFLLFSYLLACDSVQAQRPVSITVDAETTISELRPIWNYFGYDEALTTLTPEGQHLLGELTAMSDPEPIQIRVHHLLTSGDGTWALKWSSTNVYTEDEDGNPVYDWRGVDRIMDVLTGPGLQPFVQASFMPQDLSSQPEPYTPELVQQGLPRNMVCGGAFYPPKDYQKWERLIEAWARHCAERYGEARASSWLWEAWNEPESPYFRGTVEEYCKLYDHFANGVKRALPTARVGGPHVTDPAWRNGDEFMRAFLEHCRRGTNAATGSIGAPLDFIAFHAKGTTRLDEQGRVEMNLRNQLATIQTYSRIIAGFPEFSDLPVYIGESDPEGCAGCPATHDPERGYRLTSQFAAYTAASFMRKQDLMARDGGNLQGAVSWAFTFPDQPWFNGLRALTTNEVAMPVFNAFKLFSRLDRQRISVTNPSGYDADAIIAGGVRGQRGDVSAVATRGDRHVQVLLWHYHDVAGPGPAATVDLSVRGLPEDQSLAISQSRVDETHGNAYTAWLEMGSPQAPSQEQIQALHAAAEMEAMAHESQSSTNGTVRINIQLPQQSVSLVTFSW